MLDVSRMQLQPNLMKKGLTIARFLSDGNTGTAVDNSTSHKYAISTSISQGLPLASILYKADLVDKCNRETHASKLQKKEHLDEVSRKVPKTVSALSCLQGVDLGCHGSRRTETVRSVLVTHRAIDVEIQ